MAMLQFDRLPRGATPGEVRSFITRVGKLELKSIGRVTFLGSTAVVEVPDSQAASLIRKLDGASFRDYPTRVRLSTPYRGVHSEHFTQLEAWLKLEAEAERDILKRQLATTEKPDSLAVTKLHIASQEPGLAGRLLVRLMRGKQASMLPAHRLQPGAPVVLMQINPHSQRGLSHRGVLVETSRQHLLVALDDLEANLPDEAIWRVQLAPDELSRQRQVAALHRAASAQGDRLAELRDVLLGIRKPRFSPVTAQQDEKPPSNLNESQYAAVQFADSAEDLAVIHGPPGTGKTTTLVELIRRVSARGEKILVAAPSNAAVDHLVAKLLEAGLEPVRIGHPARIAEELQKCSLDALVQHHPDARQARKYFKEAQALFRQAEKWTKQKPAPGEKQALRTEARGLLAVARRSEQLAVERVLQEARLVCGTLTSLDSSVLGQLTFDLLVIDEACQTAEPACWIPLPRVQKVVFAGDPCQLPPTILSLEAAEQGFAISLMERLMGTYGESISRLLVVQYRMNYKIMQFSNDEFYGGELVAAAQVSNHVLSELPGVFSTPLTSTPLLYLDTAGAGLDEAREEESASRFNPGEAKLIVQLVKQLLTAGVPSQGISIITPYSAQVRFLREQLEILNTEIEIDSVDGFQGRENEVILLSLVRSNYEGDLGFLRDLRRMNVAMTRARRKLILVADSACLANEDFYSRLQDYMMEHEGYMSVWDWDQEQ